MRTKRTEWARRATAWRLAVTVILAGLVLTATGVPTVLIAAEPDADLQSYMALLVAARKCKDLPALPNVDKSCRELVARFSALHYNTIHLFDQDAGPEVLAPTAENVWRELNRMARAKPTLAFLVLSGHGVQRGGQEWFLTRDASTTDGGLSVRELDDFALKRDMPLVIVIDACSQVSPPAAKSLRQQGPNVAQLSMVEAITGRPQPLGKSDNSIRRRQSKVLSSLPGRVAPGEGRDLISFLAEGLDIDELSGRFRADPWSRVANADAAPAPKVLTIFDWFANASANFMVTWEFQYQPRVVRGVPDLSTVMAQVDPLGPPLALPVGAQPGPVGQMDLLEFWRPQFGQHTARPNEGNNTWIISAGTDSAAREPWIGGYVLDPPDGFKTDGKALFVELMAGTCAVDPFSTPELAIGLDAKFINEANVNRFVAKEGKVRCTLPTDCPAWVKISLEPGKKLNYVAVTDLPPRSSVILRRLVLADDHDAVPVENPNLMACWWTGNQGQATEHALAFAYVDEPGGSRVLRVQGGRGWMGGLLGPRIDLFRGDKVELTIRNPARQEATVLVEIKCGGTILGGDVIRLPKDEISSARVTITNEGKADYLALTNPSSALDILAVRLIREPSIELKQRVP